MIICSLKRGNLSRNAIVCWKGDGKRDHTNAEEFLKNYGSIFPKRYTYSDVKKLTNLFKEKIGQGGYGAVYKGQLPDGRIVAVKVLKESKGNGEEFINEVASISRTSHVNVVSLLGFCYERNKRALIYEFMPNGSLDKLIFDKGPSSSNDQLDKNKMFQIAIGIARGLEYLHRGCTTRILHFDIKPHNILLDEYLCPKISDFGLAKLCKIKESIVSMTGMRGTVGYIAPEVFSRNFGGVSHKSDVYSYGMLVLEMIGGRKNFDGEVSHTSEIYFPHWAYSKLELGESFGAFGEISEEEEETMKRMIIVSLWCIQTNPSDRPSMSKVIEMLEGTLQSLKLPPKPFLDSPTSLGRITHDCPCLSFPPDQNIRWKTPVGSHAVEQKRPALDGSSSENHWHRAINAALDTWNELVEKKNLEVTKLVGVAPGNYEDQMVMYCLNIKGSRHWKPF
uniref:Protein kinase domain-containing protein n=1 Tax=Fagus sylvatica TaxID=28930 RepID=A0A2N9IYU4_FAGSY